MKSKNPVDKALMKYGESINIEIKPYQQEFYEKLLKRQAEGDIAVYVPIRSRSKSGYSVLYDIEYMIINKRGRNKLMRVR